MHKYRLRLWSKSQIHTLTKLRSYHPEFIFFGNFVHLFSLRGIQIFPTRLNCMEPTKDAKKYKKINKFRNNTILI